MADEITLEDLLVKTFGQEDVQLETSLDMADEITLEDLLITEKGNSGELNKKPGLLATEKQIIGFDMKFESIPKNSKNINIFEKSVKPEKGNNQIEYQMKLEANHTFKDNVATSKKAKFLLVVYKSGSMEGKPWQQVQSALSRILNLTRDTEVSCSVLSYNHTVNVLNLSGHTELDIVKINKIRATGGTNFVAVFRKLGNIFRQIQDTCAYHIFFMTDGNDTLNDASEITKAKELLQVDMEKANTDIMFHVLGFSKYHNKEFLNSLRLIGTQDGTYTYVSPSEENEALEEQIVELVESTSSILGRTVHIKIACDEIEFLQDWFGESKNEVLWPALLTKDQGTTRITTTAFLRIKDINTLQDFDISLNVCEKLRGDTKPIEGIIQSCKKKLLSEKEQIDQHMLRKFRLAMNMIIDETSESSSNTELLDIQPWYEHIKTNVGSFIDLDKSNPTTSRILENINIGIDLCEDYKQGRNGDEEAWNKKFV